jgi:hypothetical protein
MNSQNITSLANPVLAQDAATKTYVDNLVASGTHFHQPVLVESPVALNATYNNGTDGVGATLTNAGANAILVIDGVTLSNTNRVLIYEQANAVQNGVYVVSNAGNATSAWQLTRSDDTNTYVVDSADGLSEGSTFFVQSGDTGAGETYTCNTSGVITFGTTDITFAQIATAQIYSAGTGLTLTGTTFSVNETQSFSSITKTGSNNVGNIGQTDNRFNTVFATASSAQYADLAEKYTADAEYAPGTVLVFGGTHEVTVNATDADSRVAGVVSTNPAYIMNDGLAATFVATVALTGRVPCRVTGIVKKGDLMVSAGYGLARAEQDPRVGTVIGKALENHEGTEGVIEVVVGRF